TLVASAMAQGQFEILTPGGPNLWWVAQSQNTMAWTCHTNLPAATGSAFQLLINNTNPAILTAAEAIIANVPIADCSLTVTQQQAALTPSTGYTLIYAVSQPFEVKALGASYPPASATPTETLSTSAAGSSGTSTGSGSSSSSTSTPKSNGAFG
ncbi:hypothetical protein BJV77DRAFT_906702, partial [Russula vinacea]